MDKQAVYAAMAKREAEFERMSDQIWEYAEPAYTEKRSAALQREFLSTAGFHVQSPVGGIDTAFVAEYGSGSPVIAILGEYDALPGLNQTADLTQKEPTANQTAGHGCGHHILGTAAVEATCAVKAAMAQQGLKGTIRYYGCPAEEGGGGKVFMIRAGLFSDVDVAISWHPFTANGVMGSGLSCVMARFAFDGLASHASAAPEAGRSALDAAELMNIGVQFLREHISEKCRIHYSFLDAGGPKANIVQSRAELYYVVRTPDVTETEKVFARVCKIAEAAAAMTETTPYPPVIVGAYANTLPNKTMARLVLNNMHSLYPAAYTQEEMEYARQYSQLADSESAAYANSVDDAPEGLLNATTDFADVSWVVPSIGFTTSCYAEGTVPHSWSWTAQGKSAGAHRGMHMAAKVMAGCVMDLLADGSLITQAKKDHLEMLRGRAYRSMLPEDAAPPVRK